MKLKNRMIDNTEWITNIFVESEKIYFTDARFSNNQSIIYSIDKKLFFENLLMAADLGRVFLANPLPFISQNNQASKDTDIEIVTKFEGYVQKYFTYQENTYVSILENNQIITQILGTEIKIPVQILQVCSEGLLGIVGNELCLLDSKLNVINKYKVQAVNAISFANKIVYQNSENEIFILENNESKLLKKCFEFVSIYYLNQKNIIISYRETNKSTLFNIVDHTEVDFIDFYMCRAVVVEKETLLGKPYYNSKMQTSLNQKLHIIS